MLYKTMIYAFPIVYWIITCISQMNGSSTDWILFTGISVLGISLVAMFVNHLFFEKRIQLVLENIANDNYIKNKNCCPKSMEKDFKTDYEIYLKLKEEHENTTSLAEHMVIYDSILTYLDNLSKAEFSLLSDTIYSAYTQDEGGMNLSTFCERVCCAISFNNVTIADVCEMSTFNLLYCIYHDSENNWIEKARINLDKEL